MKDNWRPWVAVWGAIVASLLLLGGLRWGGSVRGIRLVVVSESYVPIHSLNLHYRGPVGGRLVSRRGEPFRLPQLPIGEYHFRVDADGYAPYDWRQRLSQSLDGQTLLIRLSGLKRHSRVSPVSTRVLWGDPVKIKIEDPSLTYLKVTVYRSHTDSLNFSDGRTSYYLSKVLRRDPLTDVLTPKEWVKIWQQKISPAAWASSNHQVHDAQLTIPFERPGLYVLEWTVGKGGQRYEPVRYVMLVSPYAAWQESGGRLFWVNPDNTAPVDGMLYRVRLEGDGIQLHRVMTVAQYNQGMRRLSGADAVFFKGQDGGMDIMPYHANDPVASVPVIPIMDQDNTSWVWVLPSGEQGRLHLQDDQLYRVMAGNQMLKLSVTNGVAMGRDIQGQSSWQLGFRGGVVPRMAWQWSTPSPAVDRHPVAPYVIEEGGTVPVSSPDGVPWVCDMGTQRVAEGVVVQGKVTLQPGIWPPSLPADATIRVGSGNAMQVRVWAKGGHPADMGALGVRVLTPWVAIGDPLVIMTQSERSHRVWVSFPSEWGIKGTWLPVGPTPRRFTFQVRYPARPHARVVVTGLHNREWVSSSWRVNTLIRPTLQTPPTPVIPTSLVPGSQFQLSWPVSSRTGGRLTWVGFSSHRPVVPSLVSYHRPVSHGVRLPFKTIAVSYDAFNSLRDQRMTIQVPKQQGFVTIVTLHDDRDDGVTQSVWVLPVGRNLSLYAPPIHHVRPLDRVQWPVTIANDTHGQLPVDVMVWCDRFHYRARHVLPAQSRVVIPVTIPIPSVPTQRRVPVLVKIKGGGTVLHQTVTMGVHPLQLPLAVWQVPMIDDPAAWEGFVAQYGPVWRTGHPAVVGLWRQLGRAPISAFDGAERAWQLQAMPSLPPAMGAWQAVQRERQRAVLGGGTGWLSDPLNGAIQAWRGHGGKLTWLSSMVLGDDPVLVGEQWNGWVASQLAVPVLSERYPELVGVLVARRAQWPVPMPALATEMTSVGAAMAMYRHRRLTWTKSPEWEVSTHNRVHSPGVWVATPRLQPMIWRSVAVSWQRQADTLWLTVSGVQRGAHLVIPWPTGATGAVVVGGQWQSAGGVVHIWDVGSDPVMIGFPRALRASRLPSVGWVRDDERGYFVIPEVSE